MKTLLESFIEEKRNQHIEPKRVNVPRGQKIGLSRARLEAALISALCNFDLKGISKHLGGSYEVIRRWRAEEDFKELCEQLLDEFTLRVDVELEALAAESLSAFKACTSENDSGHKYSAFNDLNIYHPKLLEHIEGTLKRYLAMPSGEIVFFDLLKHIATSSGSPRFGDTLTQVQDNLRGELGDRV